MTWRQFCYVLRGFPRHALETNGLNKGAGMPKQQRVFKSGAEYVITGSTKLKRRLVFLNKVKIDGREILLFRPVKRIRKQIDA
jgi:RNase P/RNase MRP subunit p29